MSDLIREIIKLQFVYHTHTVQSSCVAYYLAMYFHRAKIIVNC